VTVNVFQQYLTYKKLPKKRNQRLKNNYPLKFLK